jgi:hypothetical protein
MNQNNAGKDYELMINIIIRNNQIGFILSNHILALSNKDIAAFKFKKRSEGLYIIELQWPDKEKEARE